MKINDVLNRDVLRRYSFAAATVALVVAMTGVVLLKDLIGLAFGGGARQQFAGGQAGGGQPGGGQGGREGGPGGAAGQARGNGAAQRSQGGGDAQGAAGRQGGPGAPGGQGGGGLPLVDAATIGNAQFYDSVQALGTAQARESITVTSKISDVIRAIRFESGDKVKKGQVLVELANVEQQADLNNARAQLEVDKSSYDRYNELFQKGFSPKAKVEEAQAALNRSQAQVDGMRSRISDRTIRAPFDGVVGLRTASPGMLATPGAAIATLDDTSMIKLDFDVPEAQLSKMKKNAPLAAKTAAFPDVEFEGRVNEIDSRINPSTRTVRVRALLPNASGRLKPGMLMTVEVRSNPVSALAVPEISLLEEASETFVYTVAKKGPAATVERVKITPGRRRNGMIEVLGGLKPGDIIVVNGVSRIRPGQAVRINDSKPADPKPAADGKETAGPATSQPRGRI